MTWPCLVATSVLGLSVAACGPEAPPARTALTCPAAEGALSRTSVSPDGRTCAYATRDGVEVTLQLVALKAGVDATLSGFETALLADRAKPIPRPSPSEVEGPAQAGSDAERAVRQAEADAGTDIGLEVDEDRGEVRFSLPGIHIFASDHDDTALVKVGPLTVNAGGDAATIRVRRDVRLRGETLNPERRGVRATFLYAGGDLPEGYRYVGYEAGGPKHGPITVAVVKSKSERQEGDRVYSAVRRLIRLNGGV